MHNDCCLNALIASRVLKSIIWCRGIQAKWQPLSFTTHVNGCGGTFPLFPSTALGETKAMAALTVVLFLKLNSSPDTRHITDSQL